MAIRENEKYIKRTFIGNIEVNPANYIINGAKFKSKKGFYNYIEKLFTENLTWKIGRNLDAFDDILEGGFGKHDYDENIVIRWMNFKKSEEYLDSNFLESVVEILTEKKNVEFEVFDYQLNEK